MRKEQEDAFWQTIKAFKEIGLLQHVMIIGSVKKIYMKDKCVEFIKG